MGEPTMEEYMTKTREDYGSRIARHNIDENARFELKGQFLKELCDNTFSGSYNEDANEHIENVLEIVDLFNIPEVTQDQIMLRVFPMSLTGAASRWLRNEPAGLGESAPTKLIIKLADRTIKCPKGRAENALGIDKFVFPVDFIVLDMPEDIKVLLILRRPFLSTVHAKIDMFKKKIALRVGNVKIVFKIVEIMDTYRHQDMGEVIVGKPFCRVSCVEARRLHGLITIHNGNDNVTYQVARSHPRFKHLTNKKCYKMRTILKVSARDELNGISHPYQKLKSFYKGVLDLGPEYIRDAKTVEWLTRGHVSMHEME
nr:hypothetical protein [Tanacetum cinerariifolium]